MSGGEAPWRPWRPIGLPTESPPAPRSQEEQARLLREAVTSAPRSPDEEAILGGLVDPSGRVVLPSAGLDIPGDRYSLPSGRVIGTAELARMSRAEVDALVASELAFAQSRATPSGPPSQPTEDGQYRAAEFPEEPAPTPPSPPDRPDPLPVRQSANGAVHLLMSLFEADRRAARWAAADLVEFLRDVHAKPELITLVQVTLCGGASRDLIADQGPFTQAAVGVRPGSPKALANRALGLLRSWALEPHARILKGPVNSLCDAILQALGRTDPTVPPRMERALLEARFPTVSPTAVELAEASPMHLVPWDIIGHEFRAEHTMEELLQARERAAGLLLNWGDPLQRALAEQLPVERLAPLLHATPPETWHTPFTDAQRALLFERQPDPFGGAVEVARIVRMASVDGRIVITRPVPLRWATFERESYIVSFGYVPRRVAASGGKDG